MTSSTRRRFLFSAGAAALGAACRTARPVFGTSQQREALSGLRGTLCRDNELRIFSWNIFMMPEWIFESPRNKERAAAQAVVLSQLGYDILCFQKAFDGDARAIFRGALGGTYPYEYGPANDSCSLKISSGVWVLSRRRLVNYAEILFDQCGGVECFSRKGALLVSGSCGVQPFHLVVSHLQGEEVDGFTPGNTLVRARQMEQIRDDLLLPNVVDGVPMFICGDFSTPHFEGATNVESGPYQQMLRTLGAENGDFRGITIANDAESVTPRGVSDELEYVLVRSNGCAFEVERIRYTLTRTGWDPDPKLGNLAYRSAVGATIRFARPCSAK